MSLLAVLLTPLALANGDELYDPAPPPDSAFVRFVNATEANDKASVAGREVGEIASHDVGVYVLAKQGERELKLGAASATLDVTAGQFYTAWRSGDALTVITDQPNEHLAKAQLSLYNLTDKAALSLKTADGKAAVVEDVKPGEVGHRAVNAITVELAVFDGDTKLGDAHKVSLEQGSAFSVVLLPDGKTVVWEAASTDTTK